MKNLILATTFLTSFSALANTCFVELQYQGSVLGQNVFEEQTCRDSLRQCKRAEKKYEMEHNLSELECVRLEQTLPLPPSPPTPPRPPRPALINFKGSIDNYNFYIAANGLDDFYNQCLDFSDRNNINYASKFKVSADGRRYGFGDIQFGHWNGQESICMELKTVALYQIGTPVSFRYTSASGKIEDKHFSFVGQSEDEIYNQCVEFVEDSKVGYADDIRVSFNGQRSRSYKNARSWWKTPQEVCDAMFQ